MSVQYSLVFCISRPFPARISIAELERDGECDVDLDNYKMVRETFLTELMKSRKFEEFD